MALISGKGPRRVGVVTHGIQLWTDPICTEPELRTMYDGLVTFYGSASVFVVEETRERKRIPYPELPEPPGELVGTENGKQIRKLSTDWPTLEQVLIAKRGPLKKWADKWVGGPHWFTMSGSPMLEAVAEELQLPGAVEALTWTQGSRMVEITYHIS